MRLLLLIPLVLVTVAAVIEGPIISNNCQCWPPESTLTNELVAYWPLNETSGNAVDRWTNSLELVDNNTVGSVTTGICQTVRDFEKDNDEFFSHADDPLLSAGTSTNLTFSWWANLESITANQSILSKGDVSTTFEYAIRVFSSGGTNVFRFDINNCAASYGGVNATNELTTGVWYFGVATYDTATDDMTIQIRTTTETFGIQTETYSGGSCDSTKTFRLGAGETAPIDEWDGQIGDVGFWKRVLTSDEQDELYNNGAILRLCN